MSPILIVALRSSPVVLICKVSRLAPWSRLFSNVAYRRHALSPCLSNLGSLYTVILSVSLRFKMIPIIPFRIQVFWQHLFPFNFADHQLISLYVILEDSVTPTLLHEIDDFSNQSMRRRHSDDPPCAMLNVVS